MVWGFRGFRVLDFGFREVKGLGFRVYRLGVLKGDGWGNMSTQQYTKL